MAAVSVVIAAISMVSPAGAATDGRGDNPASAVIAPQHEEGPYRIKNWQTGRCLESNHNGHAYTAPCNNSSYQGWIWETYPSWQGWWRVRNWATGLCLDGNNQGSVYTLNCNFGDHQKWVYHHSTSHRIGQRASACCVLDGNYQGSVYLSPVNNGNYQRWDLLYL